MLDRFRILTPDGLISYDTFLAVAPQPAAIKADCVLVAHEINGTRLTIHQTRLFPVVSVVKKTPRTSICLECGKVKGIIEDQVKCPRPGKTHCALVEINTPS